MAEITATMVKALRVETGQGMMECKKALKEADGDIETAQDILRKKGLAMAEKKSVRQTSEGLVAIKLSDNGASGAMVQVQCETDFSARNELFREMVSALASMALQEPDGPVDATEAMSNCLQEALSKIGENLKYVRGAKLSASRIGSYLHHNCKVGVLLGVNGDITDEVLNDLCMHIAFADPVGITTDDIPEDIVEKEKRFATQQAIDSGKPPEIAEKMIAGKMRKFLASRALIEQPFVRDDKKQVKEILGDAQVTAFARFAV